MVVDPKSWFCQLLMKVFEYVSNCYCGVNNHLVVFLVIIAPAIYKEHGSWTLYTIIVYTYIICICKYTCLPTNYHVRCTNLGCFTTLIVGFWAPVQVGAPISISQHYEILSNSPSMPIFIPVEDHLESYQNILKHIKKIIQPPFATANFEALMINFHGS